MKKQILFITLFCAFYSFSLSAQSKDDPIYTPSDPTKAPRKAFNQGYNVGCSLAKEKRKSTYSKTVDNQNFPADYRDAVRLGWLECQPRKKKEGLGTKETLEKLGLPKY